MTAKELLKNITNRNPTHSVEKDTHHEVIHTIVPAILQILRNQEVILENQKTLAESIKDIQATVHMINRTIY